MKEFILQKFKKQEAFFQKALLPDGKNHWPKDPDPGEQAYREWLRDVTDPTTGEFYNGHRIERKFDGDGNEIPEEAIKIDIPADFLVQGITRIKTSKGEFLYSRGMIKGFTQFGDEKPAKFYAPEVYVEQQFKYATRMDEKDKKWKPMIDGPSGIIVHYDLPFNRENFLKLYEKRDPNQLELTVKDEANQKVAGCPHGTEADIEMFITKPFDYLMNGDYVSPEQREQNRKDFEAMQKGPQQGQTPKVKK